MIRVEVGSTVINRPGNFKFIDYIKITIFGFGLASLWSSMHSIILPVRLLDFVAESEKNTYLGVLTFAGLVLAIIIQPIAGALSDSFGFQRGRRRPYILIGAATAIILIPVMGLVGSYLAIFIAYCLLQASINIAQGPYQALIPDFVPTGKRGLASGVKSLLEVLGGIFFLYPIAIFIDRYSSGQGVFWLWLALGTLVAVLFAVTLATVVTVKEMPATRSRSSFLYTLPKSFHINVKAGSYFVWFLVSRLFIFMSFTTIQTFALYFLRDVVGVTSPASATAQFSIVAVAGMLVVGYPAGRLSDRVGRRPIVMTAGLLGALGIALIFLFQNNYMLIILCAGLVGISFGAFLSTNWAMAIDLLPKGEEARYLGLTNLATAGGAALARLIGPVIDFFNAYRPGMGYSVMLLACFIYLLVGSALLLKVQSK